MVPPPTMEGHGQSIPRYLALHLRLEVVPGSSHPPDTHSKKSRPLSNRHSSLVLNPHPRLRRLWRTTQSTPETPNGHMWHCRRQGRRSNCPLLWRSPIPSHPSRHLPRQSRSQQQPLPLFRGILHYIRHLVGLPAKDYMAIRKEHPSLLPNKNGKTRSTI